VMLNNEQPETNCDSPHVAGILNIGTAHLGEFGGRDGICRAKSEIYRHILPQGVAIVQGKQHLPYDVGHQSR
ncbi:hypothetical protein BXA18_21875, partial [Acinetobacter baumannii]